VPASARMQDIELASTSQRASDDFATAHPLTRSAYDRFGGQKRTCPQFLQFRFSATLGTLVPAPSSRALIDVVQVMPPFSPNGINPSKAND
jgi:hypothetical protein